MTPERLAEIEHDHVEEFSHTWMARDAHPSPCSICDLILERDALQRRVEALEKALDCKNFFSGKPGSPKPEWYEETIFNEARLYKALGKEDARTVLGIWRRFKEAALRGGGAG